jgi:hypothetical protein
MITKLQRTTGTIKNCGPLVLDNSHQVGHSLEIISKGEGEIFRDLFYNKHIPPVFAA